MVEKMKRLRLLMAAADAELVMADLQKLGVVHLSNAPLTDDAGAIDLQERINRFRKVLADLHRHAPEDASSAELHDDSRRNAEEAEKLAGEVRSRIAELGRRRSDREELRQDIEALGPWGDYDPDIMAELARSGVLISFHTAESRVFAHAEWSGRHVEIVQETGSKVSFVEIRHRNDAGGESPPLFPPERLPRRGLNALRRQAADLNTEIERITAELAELGSRRSLLSGFVNALETEYERHLATLSLEGRSGDALRCLHGYVPLSLLPGLQDFLNHRSILPLIDEPESPEETPIRLKNRPLARLFEPVTRIFGLPHYQEIDTTPLFAPFFALFFGLSLADAGYGILVTLGALAGVLILKKGVLRPLAFLGCILGGATVVGGLFLNTLFGVKIHEIIDDIPALPDEVESLLFFRDINDAMAFSILLGVVQILFGFVVQVVNKIRLYGAPAGLQPGGTFLFLAGAVTAGVAGSTAPDFAVGPIPVGPWLSFGGAGTRVGIAFALLGAAVILLFNNHEKPLWIRPLLGLWEMYGIVSGLLGDVLSYIRLFALGLAGGLLGKAINDIAMMIKGENPSPSAWVFTLLVLVGGHLINFALAALGAFVHPLRLTFVEFYKSLGFTGGGKPYAPYGGRTL